MHKLVFFQITVLKKMANILLPFLSQITIYTIYIFNFDTKFLKNFWAIHFVALDILSVEMQ